MNVLLLLIVVIIILLAVEYLYRKVYLVNTHWKRQNVPHIPAWPIIGSFPKVLMAKEPFFQTTVKLYDEHKDKKMIGCVILGQPILIIRDPQLIYDMVIKDFDYFVNHSRLFFNEELEPLSAGNLFMKRGQDWHKMRGTLSPAFTSSKIKSMFKLMLKCGDQLSQHCKEQFTDNNSVLEIEVKSSFTKFTNDVIATVAFGLEINSFKNPNNQFYKNATAATTVSNKRVFVTKTLPWLMKILDIGIIDRDVTNYFTNVIFDTVAQREEKGIMRPDMLNLLIDAKKISMDKHKQDKSVKVLSNMDIAGQAFLFFFAGYEITAGTMSFACYELATNPEHQEKLHEEIDEALKNSGSNEVSYEQIYEMVYLDAVVTETLRLWPGGGGMIDRECSKDYIVKNALGEGKDYTIKAGSILQMSANGIHRDAQFYPNPNKFDPTRFIIDGKVVTDPKIYLPFGVGPRHCIAIRFAQLEVKTALFSILKDFEIVPTKRTKIPMELQKTASLTLTADGGFNLGLKQRQKI